MSKNSVLSVILIIIGLLLLAGELLNMHIGSEIWQFWPTAIILGGLYYLGNGRDDLFTALFLIGLGGAFQLDEFDIADFWGVFFPWLLIMGGVYFAVGRKKGYKRRPVDESSFASSGTGGARAPQADGKSYMHDISAVLSNTEKRIEDPAFEFCSVSSLMGSAEVDMRDCRAAGPDVTLGLKAVMGNIEVIVPQGWRLVVQGSPVLGNFEDKTRRFGDGIPAVNCHVQLECLMGNIEVRD